MLTAGQRVTALAFVVAASSATGTFAQETAPDSSETMGTETMPEEGPGGAMQQAQEAPSDQPGLMGDPMEHGAMSEGTMDHGEMGGPMNQGMMSPGPMGQGMMCSEMCAGMGGGMTGQGMTGRRSMDGMMQPGMADQGMGDHGRMGDGIGEGRMPPGMMGMGMQGHAIRIGFAIADANGDGGLSLEEAADIQARIFQAIDADDDGSVTADELQAFLHD